MLAAAQVSQHQRPWLRRRQAKALAGFAAQDVLHGHRFTGAQQCAVKYGVSTRIRLQFAAGRQVEAPGLNSPVPVAPGKGHVVDRTLAIARRLRRTRADKVGLCVGALGVTSGRSGRYAGQGGDALRIGFSARHRTPGAVRYAHLGIGNRCTLVQRRHPGQRVLAPQLEVHAQVGHQCGGAHHHAATCAVAFVQQRGAEFLRSDLHHMETGRQGYTHHFKRARVTAGRLGQVQ